MHEVEKLQLEAYDGDDNLKHKPFLTLDDGGGAGRGSPHT